MPQFKVIRASAGSGKTFNLTHEYLRLLFSGHDNFMHILAVTFTNKATEEMKSRIISELYILSTDQQSKQLEGLKFSTELTEKQLRNKAGIILKRLLHRYSGFSVSTIDAFFQRIIRGFTRELGIQGGYSIELDTDALLTEIIDRLLIKAENDKALLSWLTMFAESLIEKGENWNFRKGIRNLGREIFSEEFKCIDEDALRLFSDRNFLSHYKSKLYDLHQKIENTYKEFGLSAIALIELHGLDVDDFSNKSRGPAGFLVKLATGLFREPTNTAKSAATNIEKWYTAGSLHKAEIIEVVTNELMPLMQKVNEYYEANYRHYYTAMVILKNLFTLGILNDLSNLSEDWCSENNTFLLPDAPFFLNKIIDGNDTPFIYEKAGCWYHHFMIDEFQDTSLLQWLNFKPLISNSLSQDYDNLAVGDVKQSIYRWRNSNWEILENLINQDFPPGIMKPITLKENWRSRENIINFNNRFFNSAAAILQEELSRILGKNAYTNDFEGIEPITDLYRDVEQLQGKTEFTGGYVQVDFINSDEEPGFSDIVNNKLVSLLCELQDKGYHLNDIAVLTRKNSEAKLLADFLLEYANTHTDTEHRFDVISDEALRLGSSTVVNLIIALLQYLINPLDQTNNYYLFSVYKNYINSTCTEEKWFNPGGKESNKAEEIGAVLPDEFMAMTKSPGAYSFMEIIERIAKIFLLERNVGEQVYLQAFRDMVNEYSRKYGGDISRFMEYWRETGHEKSVSAPAGQDAVRILTLHKSKGLEFKITIIPYCTWELSANTGTILWCKTSEKPFNELSILPLSYTAQLQHTVFACDYNTECHRQFIDNLNLLYVAFTRAQDALFVMCKARSGDQLKSISDLTGRILGKTTYKQGILLPNTSSEIRNNTEKIDYKLIPLNIISNRIRIAVQGRMLIDPSVNKLSRPTNEGKVLHDIFNLIQDSGDVKALVTGFLLQGKIAREEQDKYILLIEHALKDPQVSSWFTADWNILNEAEIILPEGGIRRPDRVMTRGEQTVVVDYKFGSKMEVAHEKQVREYARLLQEMGYYNVEAYLWYVRMERVEMVVC
jgi:ATP-dependent helicase/nuclease subunit A